ncbi:MAG: HlyD family efflux transporter periplasmic adaptor subunit [Desulfitobacterium sp.]
MKRSPRTLVYSLIRVVGVGALLLLLIGSLGWVYRSNFLTGSLKVELAKQGDIKHQQIVSVVFASEETLLKAPAAGTPKFLVQEGERIRKGDPVATIQSGGVVLGQDNLAQSNTLVAPIGGLVYSATDGLETFLTPEHLLSMDVSKILQQTVAGSSESGAETTAPAPQSNPSDREAQVSQPSQDTQRAQSSGVSVDSGKVIGKIVNNLLPTVAVIKVDIQGYEVGKNVKLLINDQSFTAKIMRLLDDPQGLVVQFNQYIDGTSRQRFQEIALVVKPTVSGILIPKSSLWIKGEEQGVYVVQESAIQYRKVKILDENDEFVCVENLPHGIPVIINPRTGLDGLTINIKNVTQL